MKGNLPHMGSLIEARLKEVGMTKAEFGRRIHTSRQNVNTLLRKHHVPVDVLAVASRVLKRNFFEEYVGADFLSRQGFQLPPQIQSVKLVGLGLVIGITERKDLEAFMEWWFVHRNS